MAHYQIDVILGSETTTLAVFQVVSEWPQRRRRIIGRRTLPFVLQGLTPEHTLSEAAAMLAEAAEAV